MSDISSSEQEEIASQTADGQPATLETAAEQSAPTPAPAPSQPPQPKRKKNAKKRRRRRKVIKVIVGLLVTLILLAGIAGGMYWLFTREKPVHYITEMTYRGMLETAVQGWGYVRPVESADIAVVAKSKIKDTFFFMGDTVYEGDLLFTLDPEDIDKEIEAFNTQIADIQKKIDKVNQDLAVILGDAAERQANLTVTAPFSGQMVDAAALRVGDYVTVGERVGVMVDDSNLTLSLYFSYAYEDVVEVGQYADISIPATMSVIPGQVSQINKVRRISPEGTTLFEVILSLWNPGTLTAGMEASAVIRTAIEDVYPSETGRLSYGRTESIFIKAPGRLVFVDVMNYLDYTEGTELCRIEYREDNAQVDLLQQEIRGYRQEIGKIEEDIELTMRKYDTLDVKAPMSGTIMYNNLTPGATVDPGLAVISIAKLDKMMVEAQVDERQVSQVRTGMSVQINVWMMDGIYTMFGVVKSVSMTPAENYYSMGGSVNYYPAVFEIENYSGMLMSGQGVDYRLVVEQRLDIVIAPVIAVKNTEFGTCVFIRTDERPDNAIDLGEGIVPPGFFAVPVECGIGNENGIEILSGVTEGVEVFTQIIPLDQLDQYGGRGGIMYYG